MHYVERLVDPLLDQLLAGLPAVLLAGPRASGKTTTACWRAGETLALDRPAVAGAVAADPDAAVGGRAGGSLLCVDEWQAVPSVMGAVKVVAMEVKASAAPTANDARHLHWLAARLGEDFTAGVVFHTGPASFPLGERIAAVPISALWSTA